MAIDKADKSKIIEKYGKNPKDSGSPQVQIAMLTEKINYLSKHTVNRPKDYSAKRALDIMISKRKSILSYLEKNNNTEYKKIIEQLGLRK